MDLSMNIPAKIKNADLICGVISLSIFLRFYGKELEREELFRLLDLQQNENTHLPSICLALISLGLKATYTLEMNIINIYPEDDIDSIR